MKFQFTVSGTKEGMQGSVEARTLSEAINKVVAMVWQDSRKAGEDRKFKLTVKQGDAAVEITCNFSQLKNLAEMTKE